MKSLPFVSAALAFPIMLSTVQAQASGPYVSLSVGSSTAEHTIERNIGAGVTLPAPDSSGVTTADDSNISPGIAAGYLLDLPKGFYAGGEGFYNRENSSSRNINGVLITDVDLEHTYGARLIAGKRVTDDFSVYVHGGATVLDFDIKNSYTFAPPKRGKSERETAFSYGVGADYKINETLSLFTEYTQINDVDFSPIPEVAGGTGRVNPNTLDYNRLALGVKYSF